MPACPDCGFDNRDGAKFCSECGRALAAAGAGAREERKVVTVLFADLVGFTSAAERLDPEEVRALLQPYHGRLREELERFGGTVEKFIGDAVMALFGAPLAHEDDPERAVRAALRIRDAIADEGRLHIRVGVTTGEALVALGARPSEGEGMAAGDVVNTAARLQAAAPPDGVLVDEATYRATRDVIDYRDASPVDAKGKAEPVPAWQAVSARARFGVDLASRGGADLVGRREELSLLADALARVRRDREPQLVTLTGVPGIGKSRLVYELFKSVESGGELTYWRQGRCLSYGDGVTFWALAEIAKSHAGILETDDAPAAEDKLGRAVREALGDEADAVWVARHLRPLVGLAAPGELAGDRRGEAFAAWRRLFEALAERHPLVLVVEDLHWADDGLLDFLEELVRRVTGVPLLVLSTARPELFERRPGWGGGGLNALTVALSPLDELETAHLLHTLLERSVVPAEVQRELLARADGNPLYAEEFARLAAELGTRGEIPVPESVQGIIAARLDLLPAGEKDLLQDAAVIGKVFWPGAVHALGSDEPETRLRALEEKDFVRRARRSSVEGEDEYAFRHVLTRDVAYAQIPRGRRAEKHRAAAAWLENLSADRLDDRAEMVAHHYLSALEFARAAGIEILGVQERARLALRDAAERAESLNAFAAAARFFGAALDLWPGDDPGYARVLLGRGRALWFASRDGEEELERARGLLAEQGDAEGAAEADIVLSRIVWFGGDSRGAFERLQRAVELVAGSGLSYVRAHALVELSRVAGIAHIDGASEWGQQALALAEQLDDDALRAGALINLGTAASFASPDAGLKELELAVELGERAQHPEVARAYNNLAVVHSRMGRLREARSFLMRGIDAAERFGDAPFLTFIRGFRCNVAYHDGDWDTALALAESVIADAGLKPQYQEPIARRVRARIRLARGDASGAADDADRALAASRRVNDEQSLVPTLALHARVRLELGDPEAAARDVDELFTYAWRFTDLFDVALTLRGLGRPEALDPLPAHLGGSLWMGVARMVTAGDFVAAADALGEIGSVTDEAYCRLCAAEALAADGRTAEADAQLAQALAFHRSVGAAALVRRAERLLSATA